MCLFSLVTQHVTGSQDTPNLCPPAIRISIQRGTKSHCSKELETLCVCTDFRSQFVIWAVPPLPLSLEQKFPKCGLQKHKCRFSAPLTRALGGNPAVSVLTSSPSGFLPPLVSSVLFLSSLYSPLHPSSLPPAPGKASKTEGSLLPQSLTWRSGRERPPSLFIFTCLVGVGLGGVGIRNHLHVH